jgi:Mn-dependent DtxR family transcriptional regulator
MTTDEKILAELIEARRQGYVPSTTDLAEWVERTPRAVRYAVGRLERRELVQVARRGQRPKQLLILALTMS